MIEKIQSELTKLQKSKNVGILLAVESGSRAWGFPSADSDYDVRFIYVHRPEWYLSIDLEKRPDVIEEPVHDLLDISGWDIRKALKLFLKSNPPLLEWLQNPMVYCENFSFTAKLRTLLPDLYSPKACFHHYLHMAQGNIREYLHGETVWRKKYFYVLRPLLAMLWIEHGLGPVPIEFRRLVDATVTDTGLKDAIENLIIEKQLGAELDRGPKIPVISQFIEEEMTRIQSKSMKIKESHPPLEQLNELFRKTLKEAWE